LKPSGTGLLHWFLMQKGTIKGYIKAYWSGVTTLELAKVADHCIRHGVSGLVHLTMRKKISKYDLLVLFKNVWVRDDVAVEREDGVACDKSLLSSRRDLKFQLPPNYPDMFAAMKQWMDERPALYKHYDE